MDDELGVMREDKHKGGKHVGGAACVERRETEESAAAVWGQATRGRRREGHRHVTRV